MKLINSYRIKQRNESKSILSKLDTANRKVLIIHYSCESFYDKAGYTPRVTCIGVLNRESNESIVFSLHLQAQKHKIDIHNMSKDDFDKVEKSMLDEFYDYSKHHSSYVWVHWNMRTASYGFQAISNRYEILGGDKILIPDSNKIDLPEVFSKYYTYSYEAHKPNGQLLNLAERNKVSTRDALVGIKEAESFEQKQYLNLQMSTMRKVEIIDRLLSKFESSSLTHNARLKEIYDLTIPGIYLMAKESPIFLLILSFFSFVAGAALEPIVQKIFGTG